MFYNLNAGDPAKWLYAPDFEPPEYSDRTFENASGRVTWQVTPRNKISGFWDAQALCRTCTGATAGTLGAGARVARSGGRARPAAGCVAGGLVVAATNRLLLDAGFGSTFFGVGNFEREPNPTRDLIRVAEQCASGCAANGNIPGPGLPIAGLQRRSHRLVSLEGIGLVHHRFAQPEDRLSAHADDRRSDLVDERPEPDLPRQQRRARTS